MRGTPVMHYPSAAHDSSARNDRRDARDPNLEDPEHSQAAVLRELAWLLAGCAAAIVAVNLVSALLAAN